jgi:hypothetical protein
MEGITSALNIYSQFQDPINNAFGSMFAPSQPQMSPVQQNPAMMNPGATALGLG